MTKKYDSTLFEFLKSNQNLEIKKRIEILTKVAEGVKAQHQKDVKHYDLKSHNIFVDVEHGEIKELVIADFGIGDVMNWRSKLSHHCGTPGVGSPEQFTASANRESDIFSLGKLSVQIIFPWDTFWGIMGTPVDQSAIEKFRNAHPVFKKFHDLVTSMLEVKRDTD